MDIVLAVVLSLAIVYDLRERRIPNAITLGGALSALTLRLLMDPALAVSGLLGAGLGLLVALVMFAAGAFGAGDGKLLVTVGAFLGLQGLGMALLATGVFGGILTLYVSLRRGVLLPVLIHAKDLTIWCVTLGLAGERRTLSGATAVTVPFGPAIAAGAAVVWALGPVLS